MDSSVKHEKDKSQKQTRHIKRLPRQTLSATPSEEGEF
jgi:hypothetical protein